MKPDRVTQLLLGAIALFLCLIALNGTNFWGHSALAQRAPAPDAKFDHYQLSGDQNGFYLFDKASGRIWYYAAANFRGNPDDVGQLEEPGRRLAR